MRLHSFLHDLRADDLDAPVLDMARRCVLDLVAVAAAGTTTPLSTMIRDHACEHFAAGGTSAPLLFDGRPVSPAGAALAGGMTIDAIDAHDGHKLTKGHAGCGLFPSVLAVAQATGLQDGREFLARIVIGYEVAIRAGIALHATVADYHTSGAWVALACAGLGARALGLDEAATRHALGIAEYHGPRSQMMRAIDHPTMLKDGSGWGAMAGTSASYLARNGFTGAPAITAEAPDVAEHWADLGTRWMITEQYFKPHPVCRWAQPAVAAATALKRHHDLSVGEIETITVETFHEATRLAVREPADTEQAQYSLPFPVAAALLRGQLTPAEIDGASLADPQILALSNRVELREAEDCNDAFPAERLARVTISMRDGRHFASPTTRADGDPEAPFDDATMRAKFHAYADPVLGVERAEAIEAALDGLAKGGDVRDLFALLSASARPSLQREVA